MFILPHAKKILIKNFVSSQKRKRFSSDQIFNLKDNQINDAICWLNARFKLIQSLEVVRSNEFMKIYGKSFKHHRQTQIKLLLLKYASCRFPFHIFKLEIAP
jgi:hypothetical protein